MTQTTMGTFSILQGDVRDWLPLFPDNHFSACLCDPPYLLEFMGKEFDRQHKKMKGEFGNDGQRMQAWHETWAREVLRVMKPGAYVLAFGGTRTSHRLASALEDVGFVVEDTLQWLHGQGFPKGKTKLKPAQEPIVLARKSGANGYLALDACRIGKTKSAPATPSRTSGTSLSGSRDGSLRKETGNESGHNPNIGRWPANLILSHHPGCIETDRTITPPRNGSIRASTAAASTSRTSPNAYSPDDRPRGEWEAYEDEVRVWECHPDCPVRMLDEQSGETKSPKSYKRNAPGGVNKNTYSASETEPIGTVSHNYGDRGGASRFFYCSKVSPRERNLGGIDCRHPTLKPISLTAYLSRLLLPPHQSDPDLSPRRLLIPFSGAGSEIAGALLAGWDEVTGIEQDPESVEWSEVRIPATLESLSHLSKV